MELGDSHRRPAVQASRACVRRLVAWPRLPLLVLLRGLPLLLQLPHPQPRSLPVVESLVLPKIC